MRQTEPPKVVEYVARRLMQTAVIIMVIAGIFMALIIVQLFQMGFSLSHLDPDFAFAFVVLLGVGAFHFILALEFRNMKRWTYYVAEFMIQWSKIAFARNTIKRLHDDEVRNSFGLKSEKDRLE